MKVRSYLLFVASGLLLINKMILVLLSEEGRNAKGRLS